MNIGDKVRLLRGTESGVITRFLDAQTVEIEIEDGFKIPVLRQELAVVSSEEARLFGPTDAPRFAPQVSQHRAVFATAGVYLAFVPTNDREMSLHLLNNTDFDLPFTMGEETTTNYQGSLAGVLKPKSSQKIKDVLVSQFEQWPVWVVQLLFHQSGFGKLRAPLEKKMRLRANTFYKAKQTAPVLNKDAHLFQLDADPVEIAPAKLAERMQTPNATPTPAALPPRPAATVDLHIEQLTPKFANMSNTEMLKLQLDTFERTLENAVANAMPTITYIHGIGNGILRMELHKRLGRHAHVQFFEDAQKEKFGYGATKVSLK